MMPTLNLNSGPLAALGGDLLSQVTDVAALRVSQRSLAALANVEENGRRALEHVPAMRALDRLPEGVFGDGDRAAALRDEYGVAVIRRRDASPYAEQPAAVMGYAVPAEPDGVVLLIHDSAAELNVRVPDDAIPRVAFAELMINIFSHYPTIRHCHFAAWSRWIRNRGAAQRIMDASRLYRVALWNASEKVKLGSTEGQIISTIAAETASSERDVTRTRTTVGVLNSLLPGHRKEVPAWPYAHALLPLGYDLERDRHGRFTSVDSGGRSRWRPVVLAPDDEIVAVREMLKLAAEGRPWADCGMPLVEARVRRRGQRTNPGETYEELYQEGGRHKLGASVRAMIANSDNLHLWETGRYTRDKPVPVATDGDLDGYPVITEHGGYGTIVIDVDFPRPESVFADGEVFRKIRERLHRREPKDADHTHSYLLSWLDPYRDTTSERFSWERRIVHVSGSYVLWERPYAACYTQAGNRRGWTPREGRQVLTVRDVDLDQAIARATIAALARIEQNRLAPLRPVAPRVSEQHRRLLDQVADLERQLAEAVAEAQARDRLATTAATPGPAHDMDAAMRHSRTATTAQQRAAVLHEDIERIRARAAIAPDPVASIDLSGPAALAGAMASFAGKSGPIEVNELVRAYGGSSLRLEVDPTNGRRVRWSMAWQLPLVDGTLVELPVSGVLRNRRRDSEQRSSPVELQEAMVEDFFAHGRSIEELEEIYTMPRPQVITSLRGWLMERGMSRRGLRSAAVDLPVELRETRRAIWHAYAPAQDTEHAAGEFDRHIAAAYSGSLRHPNTWVRTNCTLARRVLNTMVAALPAAADGVDIDVLARTVGVTRQEINKLCGDRAQTGGIGAKGLGILERDPVNSWVVRMRSCPHPDCPAADGYRWLSHYLPVPETDRFHGLLCPSCWRLPDTTRPKMVFPASYFHTLWDGPSHATNVDLTTGPGTVARTPEHYTPGARIRPDDRYHSIDETSIRLGISTWAVRDWIEDPDDPLPASRTGRGARARFVISEPTLRAVEGSERHRRLRQTRPRPAEPATISMTELSMRIGVDGHFLRKRVKAGALVPVSAPGSGDMLFDIAVLNLDDPRTGTPVLPGDWIERHQATHLTIGAAATRAGVTTSRLRAAANRGELSAFVTDGGSRRFDTDTLDAWAARQTRTPAGA